MTVYDIRVEIEDTDFEQIKNALEFMFGYKNKKKVYEVTLLNED